MDGKIVIRGIRTGRQGGRDGAASVEYAPIFRAGGGGRFGRLSGTRAGTLLCPASRGEDRWLRRNQFCGRRTVGKISWDMVHPQYRGKIAGNAVAAASDRKNSKRCAASAESPSERRSWPSGFTKSGGSSSKGSKRTIGPKDSTCIAWNMSVGNKSRRRQALQPVGYGVLRRNGAVRKGFVAAGSERKMREKERVLRRVS